MYRDFGRVHTKENLNTSSKLLALGTYGLSAVRYLMCTYRPLNKKIVRSSLMECTGDLLCILPQSSECLFYYIVKKGWVTRDRCDSDFLIAGWCAERYILLYLSKCASYKLM